MANVASQNDIKPLNILTHSNNSKLSVEISDSNKMDAPKLKSLLKRKTGDEKAVIVQTTSGPFIAEPIKIRDDKRPRLTFIE